MILTHYNSKMKCIANRDIVNYENCDNIEHMISKLACISTINTINEMKDSINNNNEFKPVMIHEGKAIFFSTILSFTQLNA